MTLAKYALDYRACTPQELRSLIKSRTGKFAVLALII